MFLAQISKKPDRFKKSAHRALSDTTIWQITEPTLIQKIDERWYFGSTMFWRWRPLRRDGRIDPFTLTAAYVGPVFFSLPLLIFFPFPSPFPCLDNLLPRTPYTSILSTYVYFRVRSSSFLTVIGSLPSRPFYSFASSLFARLFFNLRRNAFHEANARRIRGGFFFFF